MTGSSAAPPTEARTELDLRRRLALALLVPLYRLYNLTLRFRFHCSEETREILASEGAVILAYWHEHIATVPWLLRRHGICLLYTSPSPRDRQKSRMPSSA